MNTCTALRCGNEAAECSPEGFCEYHYIWMHPGALDRGAKRIESLKETLRGIYDECKKPHPKLTDCANSLDIIEEIAFQTLGGCIHCRKLPCESPLYCETK